MELNRTVHHPLEKAVKDYAQKKKIKVVFENVNSGSLKPPYLVTSLLPADTSAATLCGSRQQGIFQVTVYLALNSGVADADLYAAEIMALFEPSTKHGAVSFGFPSRSRGHVLEGCYAVVISIPYFSM
ncbi:phage tail terminator-like protein [Neisseria shayeganii]|uniref:Uncharacterized protein n=1 Tax=Neisseria shayeganii 871 TaxID=1032488 RepID=G4CG97_9NEIS|nr:phage tail terminator-like protein [Neisseria shayeganii]EGY53145.1 hypothetical protein HMPREF9371_0636 [Neisseria shayeganii 871]